MLTEHDERDVIISRNPCPECGHHEWLPYTVTGKPLSGGWSNMAAVDMRYRPLHPAVDECLNCGLVITK